MTSILTTQVTELLTSYLGRAPTAAELANGLISPITLAQIHNTLNVPQSIFKVSSVGDIQTGINELSSNGGGTLTIPPGNYVLTADIIVPTGVSLNGAGPTNTVFVGAAGFTVKIHGTNGTHKTDIGISNMGFVGGVTGSVLDFQYFDRGSLFNLLFSGNNKAMTIDNCTEISASDVIATTSTSDGITITNSSLFQWQSVNCEANGGVGMKMDTCATMFFNPCDYSGNTGSGVTMNACSGIFMNATTSGNGASGVAMTGTSMCRMNLGEHVGNTTYGINITDAGSASNLILGNTFAGNGTSAAHDLGTGTLIRSNIGLADN